MTLEQCCKKLIVKSPFYGLFLLGLNKCFDTLCKTACVCRNGINTELHVNKEFWDGLSDDEQLGVLQHEVSHILFKHMFMDSYFGNHTLFNISADCQVNSYIPVLQKDPWCYAARWKLENEKGTKYYYEKLSENPDIQNYCDQDFGHEFWKDFQDLSDAEKELIGQQIDYMAKATAEQVQKSCGSIPGEFSEYIKSLFKQKPAIFNWKAYFRRLLGTAIDTMIKKSRRKESNRFDGAAGLIQKHKHKVLVAIDTSGSVSNKELCDFFSEITHVYKSGAAVDILEFDHAIQKVYTYDGKWNGQVHGRGGTSFNEPVNYFNERRNEYSACVLFTDGYADTNSLRPMKEMIWVITSNGNKSNRYPGKTIFIPTANE